MTRITTKKLMVVLVCIVSLGVVSAWAYTNKETRKKTFVDYYVITTREVSSTDTTEEVHTEEETSEAETKEQSEVEAEESQEEENEAEFYYEADDEEENNEAEEDYEEAEEDEAAGSYIGSFTLTAYCACESCCGSGAMGITASGNVPCQGVTVACNSLPLGTRIYIDGYGYYTVEDRGGMDDSVIDVYFDNHYDALEFGLQYADVYYAD